MGDGTFVAATAAPVGDHTPGPARRRHTGSGSTAWPEPEPESPASGAGTWVADLRGGRPDPRLFSLTAWRRCVTGTLHVPPPGYGHQAGLPELRRAIAARISRSRGVAATADHVLVTAGAQGAFDLCARTLVGPGEVVAVEDPGYAPARAAFADRGARVAAVPVDRDGVVVRDIPSASRAIVVTPSHQAPTGAVLSSVRRRELLALAADLDAVVIEDDYDTEHRYVDRPLEPLHRLDPSGRTFYVGTFSKTISPSLRLGFLVAPPPVVAAMADLRRSVDAQPPHLTQAALAAFLTSGGFEQHLRRTRRALHTMVTLPNGVDAEAVAAELRGHGVAIATTGADRIGADPIDLVVGFGLADCTDLARGFDLLTSVLSRG